MYYLREKPKNEIEEGKKDKGERKTSCVCPSMCLRLEEGGGQHSQSLSGVSRAWAKYLSYIQVHAQTHTPIHAHLPSLSLT